MRDAQTEITAYSRSEQQPASVTHEGKISRRTFLSVGGGLAASIGIAGVSGGLLAAPAQADILDLVNKIFNLDTTVLSYAHEMEELQADFFERATSSMVFDKLEPREKAVFIDVAIQDRAHFNLLDMAMKAQAANAGDIFVSPNASATRRPRIFHFNRQTFKTRDSLLASAVELKENCVSAYHGAVHLLHEGDLLTAAAAIAGVDGRHLAVLREIAGLDPVPYSFENQISPQSIGNRLGRYGFQGGRHQD